MCAIVVLDADSIDQSKHITEIETTEACSDEALYTIVRLHKQAEMRNLRGQPHWEGDLMALRESRILACP